MQNSPRRKPNQGTRKQAETSQDGKCALNVLNDFLHRAAHRQVAGAGEQAMRDAWVPDIQSLAKIAASIHDQNRAPHSYQRTLRRAWVWLVEARMFYLELVASPQERWLELYRSERSGSAADQFVAWLRQSTAQSQCLRLEPWKAEQDDVRRFFGVKNVESVYDKLRRCCKAWSCEGDEEGSIYAAVKNAARREIDGRECFEFPCELLEYIRIEQSARKREGGRKGFNRTPGPEAAEKIVAEED